MENKEIYYTMKENARGSFICAIILMSFFTLAYGVFSIGGTNTFTGILVAIVSFSNIITCAGCIERLRNNAKKRIVKG